MGHEDRGLAGEGHDFWKLGIPASRAQRRGLDDVLDHAPCGPGKTVVRERKRDQPTTKTFGRDIPVQNIQSLGMFQHTMFSQ
jgi:hypothetical protein